MGQAQNLRGRAFEARVYALLSRLVDRHPGFIEVHAQPEIPLLNGQIKKPDFEWVYRTEQANHELIECQSRDRSSSEIAEKIRQIKTLSSRNRFIFVFEDLTRLSRQHRRVLEADGVNCLSLDQLELKLAQIGSIVGLLKSKVPSDLIALLLELIESGTLYRSALWETALQYADASPGTRKASVGEGKSSSNLRPFRQPYHGPSSRQDQNIDPGSDQAWAA